MVYRNYKIDLHSHSIISYDGGLSANDYRQLVDKEIIDCIAITDHNEINFAKQMQKELGKKIIIGEEIMTTEGEIIGLFLEKTIPKELTLKEAICQIHAQNGLAYLPHPFETLRKGIRLSIAEEVKGMIDIVEVFNARGLGRGKSEQAYDFAYKEKIAMAASSDAHISRGVGTAYSIVSEVPEKHTLVKLLSQANYQKRYAPFLSLLSPTINKIKNRLIKELGSRNEEHFSHNS